VAVIAHVGIAGNEIAETALDLIPMSFSSVSSRKRSYNGGSWSSPWARNHVENSRL